MGTCFSLKTTNKGMLPHKLYHSYSIYNMKCNEELSLELEVCGNHILENPTFSMLVNFNFN